MKLFNTLAAVALATFTLSITFPLRVVFAGDRPNIIVILADDFGYGSTNAYGADKSLVQTPALDRLAAEGKRFTNAYTASSVCSPTRYALLTGRYAWRTSLKFGVLNPYAPLHIGIEQLNVASLLKKHEYKTAAVGKWHLGYGNARSSDARTDYLRELKPGPLDIGFDYHFGVPSNHGDRTGVFVENRYVYGLKSDKVDSQTVIAGPASDDPNFQATYGLDQSLGRQLPAEDIPAPRRKDERVMKVLTDKALAWLDHQKSEEPFFLYFTPVAVHNPVTPSPELAGSSKAGPFGDWIHELDQSVGQILKKLDEKGFADNTLVLFTSDNGGVHRPENKRLIQTQAIDAGLKVNGSLHGGKHTVWEGGFRVPYIVRWPKKVKPGSVSHEIVSVADLLATTAAIVGEALPPVKDAAQDSYNVLPAFLDQEQNEPIRRDIIVHSAAGVYAIRKGPWKWIEGVPAKEAGQAVINNAGIDQNKPQLYNLETDPSETKDVSDANPDVVAELKGLLQRYRDGGYSRELPSPNVDEKSNPSAAASAPSIVTTSGNVFAQHRLDTLPGEPWKITRGEWVPRDGGLFGSQPEDGKRQQGALLQLPVAFQNGTVAYELNLRGAQRHVLRIATTSPQHSFRIEFTPEAVTVFKNDTDQQGPDEAVKLAQQEVKIEEDAWVPVRVTLLGDSVSVAVSDAVVTGKHELVGRPKSIANFVVFGKTAGIRNVVVQE